MHFYFGTDTLVASGMADPPAGDVSHPTLGGLTCVGPTNAFYLDDLGGFPGPVRRTVKGQVVGRP